jgi:hypothetical protein
MMRETIICDARTGVVTVEQFEDNTPEYIDYQPEIEACKARLAETDYVVIKIAEGAAQYEEYADVIAERRALRARISELEQLLQNA